MGERIDALLRWWQRMTLDVVVYAADPALYGRMIVLERVGEEPNTRVLVELDPPDWRLAGGKPIDSEKEYIYNRRTEWFMASELWPEEKWTGTGQDRADAVAASGRG
jgi:hypothetical protein